MNRRRQQVTEFMERFRHPILMAPQTPPLQRLKLRASLIVEEAIETAEAMVGDRHLDNGDFIYSWLSSHIMECRRANKPVTWFTVAKAMLDVAISEFAPLRPFTLNEMVKVADGMADLDYVVEGARLEWGIDGEPIADIVHAVNMAKVGAPIRDDGKTLKPEGWVPPDDAIAAELRRQGF